MKAGTLSMTVLLPSTKGHGAIVPFERRMRRQACPRRSSIRSGRFRRKIVGTPNDHQWKRRRQPHRDHVGGDELPEPNPGVKSSGRKIDHLVACGDLQFDFGIGLAERRDQRLQQDRHHRARHREAQQPGRPLPEVTRDLACGESSSKAGFARERKRSPARSGRRCALCV